MCISYSIVGEKSICYFVIMCGGKVFFKISSYLIIIGNIEKICNLGIAYSVKVWYDITGKLE